MMMCSLVIILKFTGIYIVAFGFIVHLPAYLRGAALIIAVQHRAVVVACLKRVVEGTAGDQALLVQGVLVG